MMLMKALQTFTTVMEMTPASFAAIIGAEVVFNQSMQYAFLVGGGDYLSAFDAYRVLKMQIIIKPAYTVGVTGMVRMPTLWTAIDYDDSAGVASSVLMQYANCTTTTGENVVRTFTPAAEVTLVGGTGPQFAPWIDATSVNVTHFGCKCVVEATPAGATVFQQFTVFLRFLVEFRTTR
jgi:hypothetical protein